MGCCVTARSGVEVGVFEVTLADGDKNGFGSGSLTWVVTAGRESEYDIRGLSSHDSVRSRGGLRNAAVSKVGTAGASVLRRSNSCVTSRLMSADDRAVCTLASVSVSITAASTNCRIKLLPMR